MDFLLRVARRVAQPLTLKVDFLDSFWAVSARYARGWLAVAVACDLAVQTIAGPPNFWTVVASLLTLVVFWTVPARLAVAVGGLYSGQALISLLIVGLVAQLGLPLLTTFAGLGWWGWCMYALVRLILGYIRTPKRLMPAG